MKQGESRFAGRTRKWAKGRRTGGNKGKRHPSPIGFLYQNKSRYSELAEVQEKGRPSEKNMPIEHEQAGGNSESQRGHQKTFGGWGRREGRG